MTDINDGSVISSFFQTGNTPGGDEVYNQGVKFLTGQVDKIHFTDDSSSISKKFVEYDVSVRDAHGGQSTYRNVRAMSSFFGFNNQDETVLEPNEAALSGKLDTANFFTNKNGTLVVLAFLNGSQDKPIIIGSVAHPRIKGASRTDGTRKKGEFNGLKYEINKLGELVITYTGNKKPTGVPVRPGTSPTQIKINKDGIFSITDNKNQSFKIDRTATKISFSNGTTVSFDGANDKVSIQTSGGSQIEVDGANDKIVAQTSGGAKADIDGQAGIILIKDNADGTLKITDSKVALGTSAVELLQQISDTLDKIATWAGSTGAVHTHIGNLGAPTTPPVEAAQYIQLQSDLTAIKSAVDSIKGTI